MSNINKAFLLGRLTDNPKISYAQNERATCVARYTLAVNRWSQRGGEQQANFIRCVAFGKAGEFAEKYFSKGMKIAVVGRITTGSYTNQEGRKIYTTEVTIEEQDFADGKAAPQQGAKNRSDNHNSYNDQNTSRKQQRQSTQQEDFTQLDDDDGELPF